MSVSWGTSKHYPDLQEICGVIYLFIIILFIYFFGCTGSLLLLGLFSSCSEWGLLSTGGARASHFCRFSCCGAQASEHGLSCSKACGIFLDQGLNPCLLHWQADSLPLSYHGSPCFVQLLSSYYSWYILDGRIPFSEFPFTLGALSHVVLFGCFVQGPSPLSLCPVGPHSADLGSSVSCLPAWVESSVEGSALLISPGACSNKLIWLSDSYIIKRIFVMYMIMFCL